MRPVRRARRSMLAGAGSLLILAGLLPGAAVPSVLAAPTELFFSEYIEGSNNNKALEIYNGTGAAVNLATGAYNVHMSFNGGTSTLTINLTGTVAAGDVFVIAQSSANATILAQADQTNGSGWFNGDDAVLLRKGTAVVDAIGQVGFDPGTEWGTGLTSTADNTLTRKSTICSGDTNATDVFDPSVEWDGAAQDTFTGLGAHTASCGGDVTISVDDVSAAEGDSGTTTFDFTVSLSGPAPAGGVTFDIATQDDSATIADGDYVARSLTGQSIPAGNSSFTFSVTVNGDGTAEPDERFFVNLTNVTGATILDAQGAGTIVNDDVAITPIHDIQGSGGTAAPGTFTVEAIVIGDYQTQGSGQLRGFFLQEEDADVDADPATSEGIFVFCATCPVAVSVGDLVRVTGSSSEFFNMSQLSATTAAAVSVQSSGNPLPTPATIDLPVVGPSVDAFYEAREGMLVSFPDTLSVSEYFELARYGQVILTEGGRPHTFTSVEEPSAAGLAAHLDDLARRRVILDDTDNRQNRPVDVPNTPYYHPTPGLSTTNFFRGGDTITDLTGVLHWSFAGQSGTDAWRIRPVAEAFTYAFTSVNARPSVPTVEGRLTVASFNVLNYFPTIDTSNVCGPLQNQDCRGADSAQELERQRTKLLAALSAMDADVIGLMEMENTPGVEPLADIVAGLPGYAYVDTGVIGTDTIRVGIIYRASAVQAVGDPAVLDSQAFVNPRGAPVDRNRPAVAQTFEEVATGARFTVVVNHLKSKGSGCGAGDDDTTTGQGNCNLTRTLAAQALADWLATDPTGSGDRDVLIIGDLNSYAKEDPIDVLRADGYEELVASFGGEAAYGFVFDGQLGYLDHALSSPTLTPQVAGVVEWHINADEIPLFDYNDDVRTADEASFEEESDALPLYEPNEFRTSDHDPLIVGLDLLAYDFEGFRPPVDNAPIVNRAKAGSGIPVKFDLADGLGLDVLFTTPTSRVLTCVSGAPTDDIESTDTAGATGLQQDPVTGQYTWTWKTSKDWAGQCRDFTITFDDGTYRTALFDFTR